MIFYKFTKSPGVLRVPGYESTSDIESVSTYMPTESILSDSQPINVNGSEYAYSISDHIFYSVRSSRKRLLEESIVVDAIVPSACKTGLSIFDSTKVDRKEVYKLKRFDHVILNLGFVTDSNGSIWASVSVVGEDFQFIVEKGFVVYKNARNNFTNLYIPDAKFKTVLTNGKLDDAKIQAVKQQESQVALMSNTSIDLSDISTTTKEVTTKRNSVATTVTRSTQSSTETDYFKKIATRSPAIVQNTENFPPVAGKVGGVYTYNYAIDCNTIPEFGNLDQLHKNENLDVNDIRLNFLYNTQYYNRFKRAIPDDILSRGYMHIFFTRPDCNLIDSSTGGLVSTIANDPSLSYIYAKKPDLVKQLVLANGDSHDFMMLLSNKAKGFQVTDEGITSDRYGKTYGGYSVAFGRRKDSELGGEFEISYNDTRDLDIINLHKLWVDYINNVYRGKWVPKINYIYDKIIDYACSVYVIILAEDFETILFWTKYYGVFPVNVPYNALSWNSGSVISNPEISVQYKYSWKEDYNPLGLTELNVNTFRTQHPTKVAYIPSFNEELARSGYTWVGAPFVETIRFDTMDADKTNGAQVTTKLRFKEK